MRRNACLLLSLLLLRNRRRLSRMSRVSLSTSTLLPRNDNRLTSNQRLTHLRIRVHNILNRHTITARQRVKRLTSLHLVSLHMLSKHTRCAQHTHQEKKDNTFHIRELHVTNQTWPTPQKQNKPLTKCKGKQKMPKTAEIAKEICNFAN